MNRIILRVRMRLHQWKMNSRRILQSNFRRHYFFKNLTKVLFIFRCSKIGKKRVRAIIWSQMIALALFCQISAAKDKKYFTVELFKNFDQNVGKFRGKYIGWLKNSRILIIIPARKILRHLRHCKRCRTEGAVEAENIISGVGGIPKESAIE